MASIGLKVDHGTAGTDLAATLAKALMPNVGDEIDIANLRSKLQTDEVNRARLEAETARTQGLAANEAWQLESRQAAAPIIGEQQAALLERPEPVEQPPALAVAPTEVQTMPVPVDYDLQAPETLFRPEQFTDRGTPPPLTEQDPLLYDTPVPVVLPEEQAAYDRDVAAVKARVTAALAMGQSATDIAKGMGISEGAVRMLSEDPEQQKLGTTLYTGTEAEGPTAAGNKAAMELRKEITRLPAYTDFANVQGVYGSMLKSAPLDTRAATMDLIYGIATLEDPGSVVREQDSLMVQRTGGLSGAVQGMLSYFNEKGELTPEMKTNLMQIAANRYGSYKDAFNQQMEQYRGIAGRQKLTLEDVLPEFGDPGSYQAPEEPGLTPAQKRGDEPIILPDGTVDTSRMTLMQKEAWVAAHPDEGG